MTLILTRSDVVAVLSLDDCIAAVEEAFRAYGERRVETPQSLGVHADDGGFHVKAALLDVFAAKVNANFPMNPQRHGLPTIQGVIVVSDPANGRLLALLDSIEITILRTAAATAVAAKYLAKGDASVVTIVGCGVQGRANLAAIRRVRPIARAFGYDVSPEVSLPGAEMTRDLAAAIAASDIVITCTPSRAPFIDASHLHDGLFIGAVGADNPQKQEIAADAMRQSRVVVDVLEQAATMGDLHHAIEANAMTRDDVHAELGEIIAGRATGRTNDAQTFIFDSTGTALQDVAAASIAVRRARERGLGTEIEF
jgi:ornithine cyclodeaminase/alanine dehydrogenase-like protein (mu-crystallin family)